MKGITTLLAAVCICCTGISQSGFQFYTGISTATNNNISVTPDGTSHTGFHFGADARLAGEKMYFIVGLQYHKINFEPKSETSYFSVDPSFNWTKLRIGLGYSVFNITPDIIFRGKSLLSIDLINGVPLNGGYIDAPLNSGVAGVNLGLGLDIYNFTLDIDYEIGLLNAVNMVDDTKYDFITLSIGYLL